MSNERFFTMLDRVPRIKNLWNQEKSEINIEAFESELGVMSSGEIQIAKFFASLWFHNNELFGFDIVDAASSLDGKERDLIIEWLKAPFWP